MQNKNFMIQQYEESQLVIRRKFFMCPTCYQEIPESVAQMLSVNNDRTLKQDKTGKESMDGFTELTFEDIADFNTNTK